MRRGRSASSRRTRWTGGIFQGDLTFNGDVNSNGGGAPGLYHWASFWFKWPSGHLSPQIGGTNGLDADRVEPTGETLIRTRSTLHMLTAYDITANVSQVWDIVIGLIAFNGGRFPEAYDLVQFSSSSVVAPPNPVIEPGDEWILRNAYGIARINPESFDDGADSYLQSLAKRKLPDDVGILGVIGAANLLEDSDANVSITWNWDVRMAVRTGFTV